MKVDDIIAYAHIPKAGGTTLINFLRSAYGVCHIDVIDRYSHFSSTKEYRLRDLRLDAKLHNCTRSLAGHSLKPYLDFGEYESRLRWYTIMRDPVKRCFSQYCQDIDLKRWPRETLFAEWIEKGGDNSNRQVKHLAGVADCEVAIQVIRDRSIFVGLLESYDDSLAMLPQALSRPELSLVKHAEAQNVRNSGDRFQIALDREPDLLKLLEESNIEDIKLYRTVKDVLWDEQRDKFMPNEKSSRGDFVMPEPGPGKQIANRLFRNLIYKPMVFVDRNMNRT